METLLWSYVEEDSAATEEKHLVQTGDPTLANLGNTIKPKLTTWSAIASIMVLSHAETYP